MNHFVFITDTHYWPDAPRDYGAPKMLTRGREIHDAIPPAVNALNPELIDDITELLEWTSHRSVAERGALTDDSGAPYLRVVVLAGAGRHFCAGADIDWMRDAGTKSSEENRADSERLDRSER